MLTGATNEQFRPVRFIQMEENDNGETRVVFVSDQRYTPREVIYNAFGIPGSPRPYVIEGEVYIVERKIHHINTHFTEFIDVYFQEYYTNLVAELVPQEIEQHYEKGVIVKFYENAVPTSIQMPETIIYISEELEEVWEFATQNFVMNHHRENRDVLVLRMDFESVSGQEHDGILHVNYDFLPFADTLLESYCDVCETHFDGRDNDAIDNHERCEYEATNAQQSVSDPDAVNDNDSSEEETDSDEEENEEEEETNTNNEDIYIPREIDWNDPVDDEEDEDDNDTDVERGFEEEADYNVYLLNREENEREIDRNINIRENEIIGNVYNFNINDNREPIDPNNFNFENIEYNNPYPNRIIEYPQNQTQNIISQIVG